MLLIKKKKKLNKLDTNNKLDKSPGNYTEWKKKASSKRFHVVWFHLCNTLEERIIEIGNKLTGH